jgi:hypothetical protein
MRPTGPLPSRAYPRKARAYEALKAIAGGIVRDASLRIAD